VSDGGIVVALVGVHPAAAKPVVQTLLEGWAPSDPEAPCVRVCVSAHELLEAPVEARVVLLNAVRDAAWLNLNRPVVSERGLAMFLWLTTDEWTELRSAAPDFVDWVSHRVVVPRFGPAMDELRRALRGSRWVAVLDGSVARAAFPETDAVWLDAGATYEEMVRGMEAGPAVLRDTTFGHVVLMQAILAHAAAGWQHPVVLVEPKVIPLTIRVISREEITWESSNLLAMSRVEAALQETRTAPVLRAIKKERIEVIGFGRSFHELVARIGSQGPDPTCIWLATKLGLWGVTGAWFRVWVEREGLHAQWPWSSEVVPTWATLILPMIANQIPHSEVGVDAARVLDLVLREAIELRTDFVKVERHASEDSAWHGTDFHLDRESLRDVIDANVRRLS